MRRPWIVVLALAGGCVQEAAPAHRSLPPLCLPCGDERSVGIASESEFERLTSELERQCGEGSTEAQDWRQRADDAGIDFRREALLILWDMIGTSGESSLAIAGPDESGLLVAEIQWDVPPGPARPVATAACFSVAVDKTRVKRALIQKGGMTLVSLTF